MGKGDLFFEFDPVFSADSPGGGGPFPDPVKTDHHRLLERGRKEGAGGMGLMVLRKEDLSSPVQFLFDELGEMEFLAQPQRHGHPVAFQSGRDETQIGFQKPFKFYEGLVIKDHVVQLVLFNPTLFQTILDGVYGEFVVVFLAGKSFFLGRGDDFTVPDERAAAES